MSTPEPSDDDLDEILKMAPERPPEDPCVDDGVLMAYREGRLAGDALETVDQHLASCADCRFLLSELGAPVPEPLESWAKGTLDKRRRRWPILGTIAAVAAGLLVALFARPQEALLPEYQLRGPLGGVAPVRGDTQESGRFVPRSRFKLVLRPDARVDHPVSLVVFVDGADGRLRRAPADGVSRGEGGAFRYEIQAERLFGTEYGRRTVHVAVVADGETPGVIEGTEQEVRGRLPAHRWMTVQVEYSEGIE